MQFCTNVGDCERGGLGGWVNARSELKYMPCTARALLQTEVNIWNILSSKLGTSCAHLHKYIYTVGKISGITVFCKRQCCTDTGHPPSLDTTWPGNEASVFSNIVKHS